MNRVLPCTPAAAALLCGLMLAAAVPSAAQDSPRLPVLSLRYEHGTGYRQMAPDPESELEEEPGMEAYSERHKVTLRLREQWSRQLTTNLYTVFSCKDSDDPSESYAYVYLSPDLAWQIDPRVRWSLTLRSKLTWLEPELSPDGALDLLGLLAKTSFTVRVHDRLRVTPSLQSAFDLYQDPAETTDNAQIYTAGLSLQSRLTDGLDLTGRYRGSFRFPLGKDSTVERLFNNELTLALTWDPNR
jgi:hypothetical protein